MGKYCLWVRPSMRKNDYGTKIAKMLVEKARELQINEIILCHYEEYIRINVGKERIYGKQFYSNDYV